MSVIMAVNLSLVMEIKSPLPLSLPLEHHGSDVETTGPSWEEGSMILLLVVLVAVQGR